MKKTQRWIAIFCTLAVFNVYADNTTNQTKSGEQEQENQSLLESVKSGWNKMLDAVVGPATDKDKNKDHTN